MNMNTYLLLFNGILLAVSSIAGPLLLRLYFFHGGKRIWLSSCLETAGFPVLIFPLWLSYFLRRRGFIKGDEDEKPKKLFTITKPLFIASAVIGLVTGLDDYLYTYGVSLLPISTATIIMSTHLAFTAGFALVMVKQKFTSFSVNAVVLLTIGAILLGLHGNGDKPVNESKKDYYLGFLITIAASVFNGLMLPMVELMYMKSKQTITYSLVIELQMVISGFATLFCTIGMIANNDFKVIPREAREYGLGEINYYIVLVAGAITWQMYFVGTVGVIFCSTSLLAGVIAVVVLPLTEILSVVFYHESFQAEKGIALFLSLWGFISYFWGELKASKKAKKQKSELEQDSSSSP